MNNTLNIELLNLKHTRAGSNAGEGVTIATNQLNKRFYSGDEVLVIYPDGAVSYGTVSRNGRTIYIKKINFKGKTLPTVGKPRYYDAVVAKLGGVHVL